MSVKKAQDTAEAMADRLGEGMEDARAAVELAAEEARKEITNASKQATDFVRDHPGASLLGAVGLGVLIGLAIRQR